MAYLPYIEVFHTTVLTLHNKGRVFPGYCSGIKKSREDVNFLVYFLAVYNAERRVTEKRLRMSPEFLSGDAQILALCMTRNRLCEGNCGSCPTCNADHTETGLSSIL